DKVGHIVRDCPMPPDPNRARVAPRVYAMIEDEEAVQHTVITGTITICGFVAYTLIDTGATHSFISTLFVCNHNLKSLPAEKSYNIMLPSGKSLHSERIVKGDIVSLGDRKLYVELIVIDMKGYEVILGMDWLHRHYATISCRSGLVNFQPPNGDQYSFQAIPKISKIPIISSLEAQRLLNDGCESYLASVVDNQVKSKIELHNIPIVRELEV
ncbi:retroviral-like aspartic protease, partial [bacterium c-19]|nr:retroviral-like aspartic protease [bacterium c-19]